MKEYTTKKKIIILALFLAVVILAGGLWIFVGSKGNNSMWNKETTDVAAENGEEDFNTEDTITDNMVKEQTLQKQQTQEQPDHQDALQEDADIPEETEGIVTVPVSTEVTGEQSKPSDGKPKTPEEATPPAAESVPVEEHKNTGTDNSDVVPAATPAPSESSTPQSGDKKDGYIYIPGFGWVANEGGGVEVKEGDFELSGDLVGDM